MYQQQEFQLKWRENKTREARKDQLARIIQQQGRGGITLRQICLLAGIKKSPYAANMVADLCFAKRARWEWAVATNGKEVRVFFPGEVE